MSSQANEQEIHSLEDQRFAAMVAADLPALERLLADDLVYTHSHSGVDSKASLIELIRSGSSNYQKIERPEETIRVYGDAAVVNGRARMELLAPTGTRQLNLRYTNVWVRGAAGWQMVTWQSTAIPAT